MAKNGALSIRNPVPKLHFCSRSISDATFHWFIYSAAVQVANTLAAFQCNSAHKLKSSALNDVTNAVAVMCISKKKKKKKKIASAMWRLTNAKLIHLAGMCQLTEWFSLGFVRFYPALSSIASALLDRKSWFMRYLPRAESCGIRFATWCEIEPQPFLCKSWHGAGWRVGEGWWGGWI